MKRRRNEYEYSFEMDYGSRSVEYVAVYHVSPAEAPTGPTYSSGGEPGCDASVDEVEVFYEYKAACKGCGGRGSVKRECLDGVEVPVDCPACKGRKTVTYRDRRPELDGLVDEETLLHAAGEEEQATEEYVAEMRAEDRRERARGW